MITFKIHEFQILKEKVREAFYELSFPEQHIKSYVHDVVRTLVPKKTLDEVFIVKEELANAIKNQLKSTMEEYGFEIKATYYVLIIPSF